MFSLKVLSHVIGRVSICVFQFIFRDTKQMVTLVNYNPSLLSINESLFYALTLAIGETQNIRKMEAIYVEMHSKPFKTKSLLEQ